MSGKERIDKSRTKLGVSSRGSKKSVLLYTTDCTEEQEDVGSKLQQRSVSLVSVSRSQMYPEIAYFMPKSGISRRIFQSPLARSNKVKYTDIVPLLLCYSMSFCTHNCIFYLQQYKQCFSKFATFSHITLLTLSLIRNLYVTL